MQVQAAAAQSAYYIQSTRQFSTPVQEAPQQQSSPKTDTVEISGQARSLQHLDMAASMFPDTKIEGNVITFDNIQEQIVADQAWIEQKLAALIGEDEGEYSFEIGPDGHVNVSGGEKAEEIEQAFEDDFELHNRLARMSANSSLLRAGREHMEFAKAYEEDPIAAVAQFAYLFNGSNRADVKFEYGKDGLNVFFESMRKGREELADYLTERASE